MIINPIWFYLISVSSNLQCVCAVIAALVLIISLLCFLIYPILEDMGTNPFKDYMPKLITIGIVCAFISVLTPSEDTCYKMMVASLATKENIEITAEAGKEAIDYIVDSIDKLMDEQEED